MQTVSSRSSLIGARVARPARVASRRSAVVVHANAEKFYKEFRIPEDTTATLLGIAGWMVPAASPAPAFGGSSLLAVFMEDIGRELAHFPTGPALDSPFWLHLAVFHLGLFACMFWGCIGVQARKQGYFD